MKTLVVKELVDPKYISMKLTLTSPQGSNPRVPLAVRPTQGNGRASPSLQTRYSYPGLSIPHCKLVSVPPLLKKRKEKKKDNLTRTNKKQQQ